MNSQEPRSRWIRQRSQNKCNWQAGETYNATNVTSFTILKSPVKYPEDGNVGIC
jgi:hypothetical protein